jgi:hypothetical protein
MRRFLRVEHLVPVTGLMIFLLVYAGAPDPACTVAAPCAPDVPSWVALGGLLAPAIMVYAHRWAAAWATVACAVSWLFIERLRTGATGWAVLLPWAYAAVGVLVARYRADRIEQVAPRAVVPAPLALPGVGARLAGTAAAVLVATAALSGWVMWRQQDRAGTPLIALVVAAAGLGFALLARADGRRRGLRNLFATPQPIRTVRVADDYGYVHVLVPAGDGRTAVEFGIFVDEPDPPSPGDDDADPETLPAVLYGEPHPGRWCAVDVGGRLRVPVAPVAATLEVPYDVAHHLPREVADDDAQLVDPDQLTDADRAAAPAEVREHRVTPARRWFETLAIGLGTTATAGQLVHLAGRWHGWPAIATVAGVAAVAYEFGWRTQLRPRLRWDVGGLAAITFRRRERAMWTADSGVVHDDDGTVIVTTGDVVLVVDAPRPWPPWAAQRTADQLVAALRDARRQALDTVGAPAPPDVAEPGRPLLLYLVWAATVAGAAALFGW